jgi:hypothetical protein
MAPGGGGNIKVVVRVRPFNSRGEWTLREGLSLGLETDNYVSTQNSKEVQNVSSR